MGVQINGAGQMTQAEEIEGLDYESSPDGASPYPLDDVMVRSETRTVADIVKRIQAGRYAMNPEFQRDFVWPATKQSKLIESCLMRIPLPVLYVAEAEDGRIIVVDGLQRLSTFNAFLSNSLKLTGLGHGNPLNGKHFEDLSVGLQERIEDTQLTLYILDKKAPEAAKLDIFDRVNSGVPLSRQQMRNALYNGPATHWLAKMSVEESFLTATGASLSKTTMRDREAINRFLAFQTFGWEMYTGGDMDQFLAEALRHANGLLDSTFDQMSELFLQSMNVNHQVFGRHAFRKSLAEIDEGAQRSVINIALFDVLSVSMAKPEVLGINDLHLRLRNSMADLLSDAEFSHAISYSTNSTSQVRKRFSLIEQALSEVMQ